MITIKEMGNQLKRALDPELDIIFAKLMKKGTDANSFISEEVKKSFISVCRNCSESKLVPIII